MQSKIQPESGNLEANPVALRNSYEHFMNSMYSFECTQLVKKNREKYRFTFLSYYSSMMLFFTDIIADKNTDDAANEVFAILMSYIKNHHNQDIHSLVQENHIKLLKNIQYGCKARRLFDECCKLRWHDSSLKYLLHFDWFANDKASWKNGNYFEELNPVRDNFTGFIVFPALFLQRNTSMEVLATGRIFQSNIDENELNKFNSYLMEWKNKSQQEKEKLISVFKQSKEPNDNGAVIVDDLDILFKKACSENSVLQDILSKNTNTELSPAIMRDILSVHQFVRKKVDEAITMNISAQERDLFISSLEIFFRGALTIRLSSEPSLKTQKAEIMKLAHDTFKHRHEGIRILADVLMMIGALVAGLGLVIGITRVLTHRTFFFSASSACTQRETDFKALLSPEITEVEEASKASLFKMPDSI